MERCRTATPASKGNLEQLRNPGFNLLNEPEIRSEVGMQFRVAVTIHKGKFALRTWSINAWWDDIEFGKLLN
jgi:hypothetical protein